MENFSTVELLRVARVSDPAFNQWCKNGRLILSGNAQPGTGNRRRHIWTDVLQAAIAAELSRLGIPPFRSRLVWELCVYPNLHRAELCVFMAPRADGLDLITRVVFPGGDDGLEQDDAPVAFAVLRLLPIVERVRRELDEIVQARSIAALRIVRACRALPTIH